MSGPKADTGERIEIRDGVEYFVPSKNDQYLHGRQPQEVIRFTKKELEEWEAATWIVRKYLILIAVIQVTYVLISCIGILLLELYVSAPPLVHVIYVGGMALVILLILQIPLTSLHSRREDKAEKIKQSILSAHGRGDIEPGEIEGEPRWYCKKYVILPAE